MRLRVEVLAERRPPPGQNVQRNGVAPHAEPLLDDPSAFQVLHRFNLPVQPEQTFEQVWRNLEIRYQRSYLSDFQAANFVIKKLQDSYGADVMIEDTVADIYDGVSEDRLVLRVIPAPIDRAASIPPTSLLRPSSAAKRHLEIVQRSSKRRRLDAIATAQPDDPVPSNEEMPVYTTSGIDGERDGRDESDEEMDVIEEETEIPFDEPASEHIAVPPSHQESTSPSPPPSPIRQPVLLVEDSQQSQNSNPPIPLNPPKDISTRRLSARQARHARRGLTAAEVVAAAAAEAETRMRARDLPPSFPTVVPQNQSLNGWSVVLPTDDVDVSMVSDSEHEQANGQIGNDDRNLHAEPQSSEAELAVGEISNFSIGPTADEPEDRWEVVSEPEQAPLSSRKRTKEVTEEDPYTTPTARRVSTSSMWNPVNDPTPPAASGSKSRKPKTPAATPAAKPTEPQDKPRPSILSRNDILISQALKMSRGNSSWTEEEIRLLIKYGEVMKATDLSKKLFHNSRSVFAIRGKIRSMKQAGFEFEQAASSEDEGEQADEEAEDEEEAGENHSRVENDKSGHDVGEPESDGGTSSGRRRRPRRASLKSRQMVAPEDLESDEQEHEQEEEVEEIEEEEEFTFTSTRTRTPASASAPAPASGSASSKRRVPEMANSKKKIVDKLLESGVVQDLQTDISLRPSRRSRRHRVQPERPTDAVPEPERQPEPAPAAERAARSGRGPEPGPDSEREPEPAEPADDDDNDDDDDGDKPEDRSEPESGRDSRPESEEAESGEEPDAEEATGRTAHSASEEIAPQSTASQSERPRGAEDGSAPVEPGPQQSRSRDGSTAVSKAASPALPPTQENNTSSRSSVAPGSASARISRFRDVAPMINSLPSSTAENQFGNLPSPAARIFEEMQWDVYQWTDSKRALQGKTYGRSQRSSLGSGKGSSGPGSAEKKVAKTVVVVGGAESEEVEEDVEMGEGVADGDDGAGDGEVGEEDRDRERKDRDGEVDRDDRKAQAAPSSDQMDVDSEPEVTPALEAVTSTVVPPSKIRPTDSGSPVKQSKSRSSALFVTDSEPPSPALFSSLAPPANSSKARKSARPVAGGVRAEKDGDGIDSHVGAGLFVASQPVPATKKGDVKNSQDGRTSLAKGEKKARHHTASPEEKHEQVQLPDRSAETVQRDFPRSPVKKPTSEPELQRSEQTDVEMQDKEVSGPSTRTSSEDGDEDTILPSSKQLVFTDKSADASSSSESDSGSESESDSEDDSSSGDDGETTVTTTTTTAITAEEQDQDVKMSDGEAKALDTESSDEEDGDDDDDSEDETEDEYGEDQGSAKSAPKESAAPAMFSALSMGEKVQGDGAGQAGAAAATAVNKKEAQKGSVPHSNSDADSQSSSSSGSDSDSESDSDSDSSSGSDSESASSKSRSSVSTATTAAATNAPLFPSTQPARVVPPSSSAPTADIAFSSQPAISVKTGQSSVAAPAPSASKTAPPKPHSDSDSDSDSDSGSSSSSSSSSEESDSDSDASIVLDPHDSSQIDISMLTVNNDGNSTFLSHGPPSASLSATGPHFDHSFISSTQPSPVVGIPPSPLHRSGRPGPFSSTAPGGPGHGPAGGKGKGKDKDKGRRGSAGDGRWKRLFSSVHRQSLGGGSSGIGVGGGIVTGSVAAGSSVPSASSNPTSPLVGSGTTTKQRGNQSTFPSSSMASTSPSNQAHPSGTQNLGLPSSSSSSGPSVPTPGALFSSTAPPTAHSQSGPGRKSGPSSKGAGSPSKRPPRISTTLPNPQSGPMSSSFPPPSSAPLRRPPLGGSSFSTSALPSPALPSPIRSSLRRGAGPGAGAGGSAGGGGPPPSPSARSNRPHMGHGQDRTQGRKKLRSSLGSFTLSQNF